MNQTRELRKRIYKSTFSVIAIFEVFSILVLGFDFKFTYGLILGTAVSIINFNLLAFSLEKSFEKANLKVQSYITVAYFLRILIYGITCYYALKVGYISAAGTVLAFISNKIAIYLVIFYHAKKS